MSDRQTTPNEATRQHHERVLLALRAMVHRREVGENVLPYERAQIAGLLAALTEIENMTLPVAP